MRIDDFVFKRRGPEIDARAVEEFERTASIQLPDDYKSFLLKYNGGRSKLCVSENPFIRLDQWASICDAEDPPEVFSILQARERLRYLLGDYFLPFGDDISGMNPPVMKIKGQDKFRIGSWNLEDQSPDDIELEFASFTDLVDHLTHSDDFA